MRKEVLLFTVMLSFGLFISSCKKKEKEKNYSTWSINGEVHTSNNVSGATGKAIASFGCDDDQDRFDLTIYRDYLPQDGKFTLYHDGIPTQDPDEIIIVIYANKYVSYLPMPSNNNLVSASSVDGKAKYTLPSGWFYNPSNREDSVLVEGTFVEP